MMNEDEILEELWADRSAACSDFSSKYSEPDTVDLVNNTQGLRERRSLSQSPNVQADTNLERFAIEGQ